MRPLKADDIHGTWGTLLLPINSDDTIDFQRLEDQLEYLLESGVDGVYTNGTAGEFYAQTEDEFDRISFLVAERCERAQIPFQIGVSHTSAQTSLTRLKRAVQFKPGAVQIILPDWYPLTDSEVVGFLQRMGEAAQGIGLVLYNPPHAKRVLSPPTYGSLRRAVPNLVGIKVMDGDASWYAAMREHASPLSIFVPGHHLADGIRQGAAGSYSVVACMQPAGAKRWFELMKTDIEAALEIEGRIRQFFAAHVTPLRTEQGFPNMALDKLMAAIGGWADVGTRLRWPYRSVPESEVEKLRTIARTALPELFP